MTDPIEVEVAIWSEVSRNGKDYAAKIEAGKTILIFFNGRPFATLSPVAADDRFVIGVDPKTNRYPRPESN